MGGNAHFGARAPFQNPAPVLNGADRRVGAFQCERPDCVPYELAVLLKVVRSAMKCAAVHHNRLCGVAQASPHAIKDALRRWSTNGSRLTCTYQRACADTKPSHSHCVHQEPSRPAYLLELSDSLSLIKQRRASREKPNACIGTCPAIHGKYQHATDTVHAKQPARADELLPKLPTALHVRCTALHTKSLARTLPHVHGGLLLCATRPTADSLQKISHYLSCPPSCWAFNVHLQTGQAPSCTSPIKQGHAHHAHWKMEAKEVQPVCLHVLAAHNTGRQTCPTYYDAAYTVLF